MGFVLLDRRNFIVALGALPAAGCALIAAPGAGLPPLPAAPAGAYHLGAGDELAIRIYDQPQLSGAYTIDDSGMIDIPLLGFVPASGIGTDALAAAIAASLQDKNLILHPSVAVQVQHYRPFYILGEVTTPGQYPYRPRMTVLTAISIAGGFTYRAVQDYVGVTRDTLGAAPGGPAPTQYRAAISALAQPGDVITVFERHF